MREIIEIDEASCTGCGDCVIGCPEGAIQVIEGKARLVNEAFCDGLGACIGECPEGAITIEKREAEPYDEAAVVERIVEQDENVLGAHLEHLEEHGQYDFLAEALDFLNGRRLSLDIEPYEKAVERHRASERGSEGLSGEAQRGLSHWPIQLKLVPPEAPFLQGADLVISADCVGYAYPDFHRDLLGDRSLIVGCPKLDDAELYMEKLEAIFENNDLERVTVAQMRVPCCLKLTRIVETAADSTSSEVEIGEATFTPRGERMAQPANP